MSHKIYTILFLICVSSGINAQRVIKITGIQEANKLLADYLEVFCDTTNSIDVTFLRSGYYRGSFTPITELSKEILPENTYWVHFILENPNNRNRPIGIKFNSFIPYVDVYAYTDSVLHFHQTGFFRSGKNNDELLPGSNIIQIPDADRIEYYIRISYVSYYKPPIELDLIRIENETNSIIQGLIFDALLHGVLWLIILCGFLHFFSMRDRVYLYYAFYALSVSILLIWTIPPFAYQLAPNLPRSIHYYGNISSLFPLIFYIQFIRKYLRVAERFPKWHIVFHILQIIVIIVVLLTPIFLLVIKDLLINLLITRITAFCIFIVVIVFVIKLFQINETMPRIIAVGSSILIVGTSLSLILALQTDDLSVYVFQKVGFLLELMIFTYALSYRHWLTEKEKLSTQKKLIIQLNKNAELQTQVQRELEDKVKERTLEINNKNKQLEHRNDEITAQRDEIEAQHRFTVEQKEQIESQNKSITDSIEYAQRIQSAILPPESLLHEILDEVFILYKPRDIVSGDFYWIKQVNQYIILAAADCTGHGVPGALLSMLGISYLNEIVQTREITQANQILNELRNQIKHSLRQHGQPDECKDGIDMALCVIDTNKRILQYSGAYNPIYLISDEHGTPVLKEIKADRMPVGYYQGKAKSFSNHNIPLEIGDTFYIFSDGFVDQKGGRNKRKFMSKNFKNLLLEIHEQPLHDQKRILDKTLTDWMDGTSQIDDILVVGVRV